MYCSTIEYIHIDIASYIDTLITLIHHITPVQYTSRIYRITLVSHGQFFHILIRKKGMVVKLAENRTPWWNITISPFFQFLSYTFDTWAGSSNQ